MNNNALLPELLTARETAAYLRMPQPTVYNLIRRGILPARKIAGRWRVVRPQLDDKYDLHNLNLTINHV